MRKIFSVLTYTAIAIVATQAQSTKKDVSVSCLVIDDLSFYDLRLIQQNGTADYSMTDSATSDVYYFNICGQTVQQCPGSEQQVFAYKKNATSCTELTNFSPPLIKVDGIVDDQLNVVFASPAESTCANADGTLSKYQFTLNLKCSDSIGLTYESLDVSKPCSPVLTASHSRACPVVSATGFARFFLDNAVINAPLAILFGLAIALYGRKFFPVTIFAAGGLAGFGITMILVSMVSFLSAVNTRIEFTWVGVIVSILISACIGVFLGFILQKMQRIGAMIIGAIGGFFISVPLFELTLSWVQDDSSLVITVLSVIAAISMAVLSLKYYDNIIIFGTSILGAYCFTRGISLIFGGFDESTILDQIASNSVEALFYLYVAIFLALSAAGGFYQHKQRVLESLSNFIKL